MLRRIRRPVRLRRKIKDCSFCKQKIVLDYKEIDTLKRFVTERGKIIPRSQSGICQKHQRLITISIKRARFLSLLPFIVRPS